MTHRYSTGWTGVALAAILVLGLALAGCAGTTWGSLKTSQDLNLSLENRTIDPSLAYYYCGRSGLPYVVVGIDKAYTFTAKFWFKIETMDEVYKKIDHLADLERGQYQRYTRQILAPDGHVVGTYYSYYHATSVSVDEGAKTVWIANPYKPETQMRLGS